jgi:hypothetical protein
VTVKAITVHDVAVAWGAQPQADGAYLGSEYLDRDLPILAGCEECGATLAPYNAYPSVSGYIRCADCLGDGGYESARAFEADLDRPGRIRPGILQVVRGNPSPGGTDPRWRWWDDPDELLTFGRILDAAGILNSTTDAWYYLEKPWKWDPPHQLWVEAGRPYPDTPAFDEYLDTIEGD